MTRRQQPHQVDTIIVGSGPSALILSYILHGNIPIYDVDSPHPDPILHNKLQEHVDLLTADVDHLTEHFYGSRFSYSTQALPVNVLLDTLIRPYGETDEADRKTCVKWIKDANRAVPHIVVGRAVQTGGQWAENPVQASWDIGTLSYAGMLSLPGYSFEEHYLDVHGERPPFYLRPTRRDVAQYLAVYPHKVGISGAVFSNEELSGISRLHNGFHIASHDLRCTHLVLASGTFTSLIPPRPLLQPLLQLENRPSTDIDEPLLVIGSGFSAADVILSAPRNRKIIHIYKWDPQSSPSPLRACHQQAYPEYAGVYKKMKMAATASKHPTSTRRFSTHHRMTQLGSSRDWSASYEGLPNTVILDVEERDSYATVTLQTDQQPSFTRNVGTFAYVVGRRGSLTYLEEKLCTEICRDMSQVSSVAGATLRERVSENLELASNVFITGSLTGDSLIRFAYGACTFAAGTILARTAASVEDEDRGMAVPQHNELPTEKFYIPIMKGLQGHQLLGGACANQSPPLDRRKSEVVCVQGS